ncbi:MAG: transglycosylase SLT domain-containing protein, partial [Thermoanaerobaculum sp.]
LAQAPPLVRQELTPRLCTALIWRGKLAPAQHLIAQSASLPPASQLCKGVLALHLGKQEEARRLLAQVLANPQAGRLRELVGLVLPLATPSGSPPPTRNLGELATLAVERGVPTARQALLAALHQDPDFAPLFSGNLPPPALPPAVAGMLDAGFAREVAMLLAHLLPQSTPRELAWSAAFLTEGENFREAARLSEKLWSQVGPIPAFLLPDELLTHMFPKAFSRLLPVAASPFSVLLLALARQESRFDNRALSPVGARGLWQLMPATVSRLAPELIGSSGEDTYRLLALRHLQASAKRLGSDPLLLAAAYNAGDSWVELWLGQEAGPHPLFALAAPYAETRSYLLAVTEGLFLFRHLE